MAVDATAEVMEPVPRGRSMAGSAARFIRTRARISLWISLVVLAFVVLAALFPGLLAPGNATALHPTQVLQGPGGGHVLGTDNYGRSVYRDLVYGSRRAMEIGVLSVVIAAAVGGLIGMLAGYLGGLVDSTLMRIIDVLMCFPGVLLALVIAAALGSDLSNEIVAVGVAQIPAFARVMRGQVLTVRNRLYVDAAVAAGLRRRRIMLHHIMPNALAPIVVLGTVSIGISIVLGASLSFLGLGPSGGIPDWGQLLSNGEAYLSTAWWIATFPGLLLTVVVIAVNLIGDWLRDRLDVAN